MTDRVQWRVDPLVARGFGPQQIMVYIASVYVSGRCIDSIACSSRREARKLASEMAHDCRAVFVTPESESRA